MGSQPVLPHSNCRCSTHTPHPNGSENVIYSTQKSRLARALAVGLSAAMLSGLALVAAAPAAAAAADPRYAVTGSVNTSDGDGGFLPLAGVQASISFIEPGESVSKYPTVTAADGSFSFQSNQTFPAGDYTIVFEHEGYVTESVDFTIAADVNLDAVTMAPVPPELAAGTVAISGTPVVGNVLTAVTEGWPAGATLTYQWFYNGGQMGGDIEGATGSSYTVTDSVVTYRVGVSVTGSMAGNSSVSVYETLDAQTSAPKKAPAPAPTNLAAYLQANGSTPEPQTSTGLPAGALDTSKAHTANVAWFSPDSFVDVYVFSSPVFVGTFPVVNGVAQITLSTAVLGKLAAGNHTLVVTGQSSGAVQSVALAIGLPATGSDPTVPVTVASLLMMLGAGLMFVRRHYGARV
jgi:LPXTG-motif cell wall-anchored protein